MIARCRRRPITDGKTARGVSSPENPALHKQLPASTTTAAIFSRGQACKLLKHLSRQGTCTARAKAHSRCHFVSKTAGQDAIRRSRNCQEPYNEPGKSRPIHTKRKSLNCKPSKPPESPKPRPDSTCHGMPKTQQRSHLQVHSRDRGAWLEGLLDSGFRSLRRQRKLQILSPTVQGSGYP